MAVPSTGSEFAIELDRETFLRQMVAGLGHLSEGILGSDVAGTYVMNVGLSLGAAMEEQYKQFLGISDRKFTLQEYGDVIVDLHAKIGGGFSVVSMSEEKVVVETACCPFTTTVRQSPALCLTTSTLLGGIAARNFDYAKVVLHRRIALGDPGCHVTVHLKRTAEAKAAIGKEYFPDLERSNPDITQQLLLMERVGRQRRQMSEGNVRWDEVARAAAEAVCVVNTLGKVMYANGRWRDVLGVEGDELVGSEYVRMVHPNDQPRARDARHKAMRGERVPGVMLMLRHRDGSWRDLMVSMGPVRDESGHIVGVLDITHDMTEQRHVERVKDHYLTAASNQIRTPVSSIKVLSQIMLRSLKTRAPLNADELAHRIEIIQREADRLAAACDELLDVSRFYAGKLITLREHRDLNEIVVQCADRQRAVLGDTPSHAIALLLEPQVIPVNVEPSRIEQVIENLLDNAVRYSPVGTEIAIVTQVNGEMATVAVTNQGGGIAENELGKVFTPLFRGANMPDGADADPRLGLGLYLSRNIVEAHGGSIGIQSAGGQGATFTVTLPMDTTHLTHSRSCTILVVDDDEGFQETLQMLLHLEGYDVALADNGDDALNMLDDISPDLILLDLIMPKTNGFQFVQALEERGLRSAIPILVLTADTTAKSKLETMGVTSYIAKPFDIAHFLDRVRALTTLEFAD